jgi:hypothetical protein
MERDGQSLPASTPIAQLAAAGWTAKQAADQAADRLKQANARLIEAAGVGVSLVLPGACRIPIAERETAKVTDAERLRQVLGGRFEDLVEASVSYRPTPKLLAIARDPAHPLGAIVGELLAVSTTQTVSYRSAPSFARTAR